MADLWRPLALEFTSEAGTARVFHGNEQRGLTLADGTYDILVGSALVIEESGCDSGCRGASTGFLVLRTGG